MSFYPFAHHSQSALFDVTLKQLRGKYLKHFHLMMKCNNSQRDACQAGKGGQSLRFSPSHSLLRKPLGSIAQTRLLAYCSQSQRGSRRHEHAAEKKKKKKSTSHTPSILTSHTHKCKLHMHALHIVNGAVWLNSFGFRAILNTVLHPLGPHVVE